MQVTDPALMPPIQLLSRAQDERGAVRVLPNAEIWSMSAAGRSSAAPHLANIYQQVYLSIYRIYLSICIYLSMYLYLSIYIDIYLYMYIYLYLYISIYLYIYMCVYIG